MIQSATRMATQPWVIAEGLTGIPESIWRRFMNIWLDWSVIVAEGEAKAQEILSNRG